jgi:archaeosine synthase beta-subunit
MNETGYPSAPKARDEWVLRARGPKSTLDPRVPYAFFHEEEPGPDGAPVPTSVILITNRECPIRCLMCDLWKNTLDERVPSGAIAAQIRYALERLPQSRQVKLYNAGSFFDSNAIPPEDYSEIASTLAGIDRIIVESHPAFVGERVLRFRDLTRATLEVAIGLETVQPGILEKLNKRMTIEIFEQAADYLENERVALRVFLMLRPPFVTEREGVTWAERSIEYSAACAATACSIIPTRGGNGAMELIGDAFEPPRLQSLERVIEYGISRGKCRVFADLWDVDRLFDCRCSPVRASRLDAMNHTQAVPQAISCESCSPVDEA